MANVPDAVKRLVDRLDQDRKAFLSSDYKRKPLSKAKTPPVPLTADSCQLTA
ncbi:MAG: hypothetical protein NTX53_09170 [candidate division WOR-3 bacterium]|nr:hypothetical protein [candidate division WOR-3 bacterium]